MPDAIETFSVFLGIDWGMGDLGGRRSRGRGSWVHGRHGLAAIGGVGVLGGIGLIRAFWGFAGCHPSDESCASQGIVPKLLLRMKTRQNRPDRYPA